MNKKCMSFTISIIILSSILGFLVLPSQNSVFADTIGDMHITVNTTWNISGSPYYIEGNVMVDPGKNLTIDPGVEVFFHGNYNLYVDGTLYAVGNGSNHIKFTTNLSFPLDEDRFNIQINATGSSIIKYCNISYALYGINLSQSSQNIIQNNFFTDNFGGILLEKSSNNTISNNMVYDNVATGIGINLRESFNNIIENNDVNQSFRGINLYKSYNNTVRSNDVFSNFNQGIYLFLSNSNFIQYNYIFSNMGDGIDISNSDFNEIFNNNISDNGIDDNDYGIEVDTNSEGNLIYFNTFFYNFNQTFDATNASNYWDNGYPQGGNFYSNYNGIDVKRGANQDIPGSDGLGDTPYIIDSDSQDNYPLMTPMRNIAPFLIALISPANGSVVNPQTIIDLDILAQSFNTVNYTLNGGTYVTITAPFDIIVEAPNWTEGQNRLDVYVTDTSMNVNSSWFEFIFDSLAPQISLISPANNSKIKAGEIINISVVEPNLNFVTMVINNGSSFYLLYPYDIDTSTWPDENYTIDVFAEDLSGTNTSVFYNFTVDSTPPGILFNSPGNSTYLKPGVPLEFLINDEHLHTTSYSINGGSQQSFDPGNIVNTSTFSDGPYSIRVFANDSIGNQKISTFIFWVDSVVPQIVLNSPNNNSIIQQGDPINFSVIDESPVTFNYFLNIGNEFPVSPPYELNTTTYNDLEYKIYVNVTDYAGNQNISWFNITVDSQAPEITLREIVNDSYILPGTSIIFGVFDPNLAYANYSLNGGGFSSLPPSNSINTTDWGDGTYTIEIFAIDTIGNFAQKTFVLYVDTTSPTIVSTSPKDGETGVAVGKTITITFSEPMDDIALLYALSITPNINFTPRMTLDNLTLVIDPDEDLIDFEEYIIFINSSASDHAGNPLSEDYTFSFKTGAADDDLLMLLLPLLFVIIVILIIVMIYLFRRKQTDEAEVKEEDFDLDSEIDDDKKTEDLIEEGLGEDEGDLEKEIEDIEDND